MKKLLALIFLAGCASRGKPMVVRDCQPVNGDGGFSVCLPVK